MTRVRKVAVLIESSRETGRRMIQGVAQYSQQHTSWSLYFEPRGLETVFPRWLRQWQGDGILARLDNRRMMEAALAVGVPVVDLRGFISDERLAMLVIGDNPRIVEMAFEHLRDLGLQHFGFCGIGKGRNPFLDERREILRTIVTQSGFSFHDFTAPRSSRQTEWDLETDAICEWLQTLPKPIGIVACNDDRGYQVLEASRRASLRVPDEIAVIGVDNDPVICNMSVPPLSSIDQDAMRIGFEAAAWLDQIMTGHQPPKSPIIIEPRGVIPRHSTDVLAIDDADTVAAVRYIRQQACLGARVKDVLRQVPISQSELERRFKHYLGRTPKDELLRVQIARARQLLLETDLPLAEVAKQSGFSGEKYFGDVFHRVTHTRPAHFRRQYSLLKHTSTAVVPPANEPL